MILNEKGNQEVMMIREIQIDKIDTFPDHPYRVRDDMDMDELVESIRANGQLTPCILRPLRAGRYELVSGHRRRHDPSQRANGFLTLAGGIIITFTKEILNLIVG